MCTQGIWNFRHSSEAHREATTEGRCKHASGLSLAEHKLREWQADGPPLPGFALACFAWHRLWKAGCQTQLLDSVEHSIVPISKHQNMMSKKHSSNAIVVRSHLEECQNVWVCQAVLVAPEEVRQLAEALLPNAQLPKAEGYVPPLLVVLHTDRQTDQAWTEDKRQADSWCFAGTDLGPAQHSYLWDLGFIHSN